MNKIHLAIICDENEVSRNNLRNANLQKDIITLKNEFETLKKRYDENHKSVMQKIHSSSSLRSRDHEIELATRQIRNGVNRLARIARR